MRKTKTKKILHFIVYLLPLLFPILEAFRLGTYDLNELNTLFATFNNLTFFKPFYDWSVSFFNIDSIYFNIMFGYLVYMAIVEIMFLMFDFLMFVIRFARQMLNKFYE